MKYLFVLALFLLAVTLVYWRVRPYVTAARRFLGVFRDAQRLAADDPSSASRRRPARAGEKLTRCAVCGTWLPASRALALRGTTDLYCSHACLEARTGARPARRKTAS